MAESGPGAAASATGTAGAHLLLASQGAGEAAAYCEDHRSAGEGTPAASISVRTTGTGPAIGGDSGVVVVVGDPGSAAGADVPPDRGDRPPSPPEIVEARGDLADLGVTVDGYVTAWSAAGYRPVVCVDSLAGLLRRSSMPTTFRWLFVLRRRVDTLEAAAHVHADPRNHEREILRTFYPLFDRVVTFQGRRESPS